MDDPVVLDTSACFALLQNKDPEFDALKGVIQLHPLPPKAGVAK